MHALDAMRDASRMAADTLARLNGHSPKWRAVFSMRRYAEDSQNDRAASMARQNRN